MDNHGKTSARRRPQFHLVFGSGGSKAILTGAGALAALHTSGFSSDDFVTIGGASGGSIPAALFASGKKISTTLNLVIETDFSRLLTPRTGWLPRVIALLSKYRYETTRPVSGVFSWERMQALIDERIPTWPAKFWNVAACEHGQILFCKDGAFKYMSSCAPCPVYDAALSGSPTLIERSPPSVGFAVCASCAVPGILDAAEYWDEHLFDGALSGDGECPVDAAKRHFKAPPERIIAIDVGEESVKRNRWLRALWTLFCRGGCGPFEGKHPTEADALLVVRPEVSRFHGLKFNLSRDDKWLAVAAGYLAMHDALYGKARRLQTAGLLYDEAEIVASTLRVILSVRRPEGEVSRLIEQTFERHGLL